MIKSIRIYFRGIEPMMTVKGTKTNEKYTREYAMFYRFRRIKGWFANRAIKQRFIKAGFKPILCQGCGEGWVEFKITNPNRFSLPDDYKRKPIWNVCRNCVSFYDMFMSKKPYNYRKVLK